MREDSYLGRAHAEAAQPSLIARVPGGLATLLAGLLALVAIIGVVAFLHPWGAYFPGDAHFAQDRDWPAKALHALKEPALGANPKLATKGVSELRVLRDAGVFGAMAVRYTFDANGAMRRAVRACEGKLSPGPILEDRTTRLSPHEATRVLAALDDSGYWTMPVDDGVRIDDGGLVVVETVRDGVHRVRSRVDPGDDNKARGLVGFERFQWSVMRDALLDEPQRVRCAR